MSTLSTSVAAPPAPDPAAFFEAAEQAFQVAVANRGQQLASFVIGGQQVQLRFAGPAWQPQFTAALAHRAAPPAAHPNLSICIWDAASTGVSMPPPPWSPADYAPRSEIAAYCTNRFRAAYQIDAGLLSLLDLERGLGLLWTANAATLPRYELTFPARALLYWWAAAQGQQLCHAGAVGQGTGGALLVGKGGSGKSTTALACLAAGLNYAGDDYLLCDNAQPAPRAHSLYNTGKLHGYHVGRLPAIVPLISNRAHLTTEKALLYLNERYAEQLVADLPLSAIVLPRVTGEPHTRYHRIGTVPTLAALAASTMRQLPGAGPADHQRLSRLAQRLPGYVLELGTDLDEVVAQVSQLIVESADGRR